jgi:hypothetical protein
MWNLFGCFCRRKKVESVAQTTEPIVDEPVAHEPVAHEPVAHEPVAHEPVAPEPVAPEPIATEKASFIDSSNNKVEETTKKSKQFYIVRYSEDKETWKTYNDVKVASTEFKERIKQLLMQHINKKSLLDIYIHKSHKPINLAYSDCDYEFIITIKDEEHHIMISRKELFNMIVELSKKFSKRKVRPYMNNEYHLIYYYNKWRLSNPFKKQKRPEDMKVSRVAYGANLEINDIHYIFQFTHIE